jgi:hypothetical protein
MGRSNANLAFEPQTGFIPPRWIPCPWGFTDLHRNNVNET